MVPPDSRPHTDPPLASIWVNAYFGSRTPGTRETMVGSPQQLTSPLASSRIPQLKRLPIASCLNLTDLRAAGTVSAPPAPLPQHWTVPSEVPPVLMAQVCVSEAATYL